MARQTAKYRTAVALANQIGVRTTGDAEALYGALTEAGHAWDSRTQTWSAMRPPIPPTNIIRIRVWAYGEVVEELVDDVVRLLETVGLQCDERSPVYPCRPPQQLEGRVYLNFTRKSAKR